MTSLILRLQRRASRSASKVLSIRRAVAAVPEPRLTQVWKTIEGQMGPLTSLGDNKGILQPIPHTVKTNKAGLQ